METRDNSSPPLEADRPADDAASPHGTASTAKAAVEREMHDAKERLSSAGREIKSEASGAAGTISSLVSEQAERQKDAAVDHLSSFAQSVRRAADDLGKNDNSMSARLVQEAAHSLERLSGGLQSRSVSDLTRSVTSFGRENPTAFLAGCLLAGVAVGRFLTASSTRAENDRYRAADDDWRSGERFAERAEDRWPSEGRAEYPGTSTGQGAGSGGAGLGGGVAAGYGGAAGQAGTFGGTIAPSSAERAPGDLSAQGTMMDDPEPTTPSDSGLGERLGGFAGEGGGVVPKPHSDRSVGQGGRDGDL